MEWVLVLVVLILVIGAWFVFTYNRLVSLRNRTQEAWSGIDVELKRRHDLIPNLVEMGQKEGMLTQALRQLFAVAENYPELKAVASFQDLQQQLAATEDKIEFSRRFYNGNVRDYNTSLQTLPTSLIAGALGFRAVDFFQADEGDRALPQVSFTRQPPAQTPPA